MLLLMMMQLRMLWGILLVRLRMVMHQMLVYPYCKSIHASEHCNYLTIASGN